MIFFFGLFLSEPFYLSHTEGSYTDWGRGLAQEERDWIDTTLTVFFFIYFIITVNHLKIVSVETRSDLVY